MAKQILPRNLKEKHIYFIGIKGTGMTALAEILQKRGAIVSGSDTVEKFYTDKILYSLGIPYYEGFLEDHIPKNLDFIIHSAAYSIDNNSEMEFVQKLDIPVLEYTEALGQISLSMFSCGITGVHGKTTTTAIAGSLLKYLKLPATTLVGSGVSSFDGRSSFTGGDKYFIAETCEYKRHFLHFHPDIIVLTNIEIDHMDYYKDYEDIEEAFISYMQLLPLAGKIIYCLDNEGARDAVSRLKRIRPDIKLIEYGKSASGPYRFSVPEKKSGINSFNLAGFDHQFRLKIPGEHIALDAAAAIALIIEIMEVEGFKPDIKRISEGLASFAGSTRRSEFKGEYKGVIFMDDYGHHPTEISATLKGLKELYPNRRIVVDFMSHTYSRTEALFDDFASCFSAADIVVLHKIYSSAREKEARGNSDGINGLSLYKAVSQLHNEVYYFHEIENSLNFYLDLLHNDDLFITMGAGNNWIIGDKLIEYYKKEKNNAQHDRLRLD